MLQCKRCTSFTRCHWSLKDTELFLVHKKGGWLSSLTIQDLLSRVPLILHRSGQMWCFEKKNVAMGFIVVSHTAIDMNWISGNIKAGVGILEHTRMLPKDVPIILRYTITCFASPNGGKLKLNKKRWCLEMKSAPSACRMRNQWEKQTHGQWQLICKRRPCQELGKNFRRKEGGGQPLGPHRQGHARCTWFSGLSLNSDSLVQQPWDCG